MALMRAHNRQGTLHSNGIRARHGLGGSVEHGGLVEYFFGKDGHECLHHDKFVQFLFMMKAEGAYQPRTLQLSMVASADLNHLSKLLDRVDDLDEMPHTRDIRITLDEFKSFAELRKKLQPFLLALFSFGKVNGVLTKRDFKQAASQEWTKHGRKSGMDQVAYFSAALDLLYQLDLANKLSARNIHPNHDYFAMTIQAALKALYGKDAQLICTEVEGRYHLIGIKICFDHTLKKYEDCPTLNIENPCGTLVSY